MAGCLAKLFAKMRKESMMKRINVVLGEEVCLMVGVNGGGAAAAFVIMVALFFCAVAGE